MQFEQSDEHNESDKTIRASFERLKEAAEGALAEIRSKPQPHNSDVLQTIRLLEETIARYKIIIEFE